MLGRSLQQTAKKREARVEQIADEAKGQRNPPHHKPPLVETVNRMKHRWLQRVMYKTAVSSTAKCLAYAIADHLNCVTLDCWPGQLRLAQLLSRRSIKTLTRAAKELEEHGVLVTTRDRRNRIRYVPVFLPEDEDISAAVAGKFCPEPLDRNGRESFLSNPSNESVSKEGLSKIAASPRDVPRYDRRQRGAVEIQLADMLGKDGMAKLQRLAWYDDAIVDRLCRAYVEGTLDERSLNAARLAAAQM